jgi:hypothetical protein
LKEKDAIISSLEEAAGSQRDNSSLASRRSHNSERVVQSMLEQEVNLLSQNLQILMAELAACQK